MVIKGYYDGSGKGNSATDPVLVLAGFDGTEEAWAAFGLAWRQVLADHGLTYWHTTDATDWDAHKAASTLDAMLNVIADHGNKARAEESRLSSAVTVVYQSEYATAKLRNIHLRPAAAICVNGTVGHLLYRTGNLMPEASVLLYFDQNEEFMKEIYRVWTKGRSMPSSTEYHWAKRVETINDLDSKKYVELQAADAFAWLVARYYGYKTGAFSAADSRFPNLVHAIKPRTDVFRSLRRILHEYPNDQEEYRYFKHVDTFGTRRERSDAKVNLRRLLNGPRE